MSAERLIQILGTRPFRPFALRLANGELVKDLFLVTSLETVPARNARKRRR